MNRIWTVTVTRCCQLCEQYIFVKVHCQQTNYLYSVYVQQYYLAKFKYIIWPTIWFD